MSGKIRSLGFLLALAGVPATAGEIRILDRQLDNLESRTLTRQGARSALGELRTRQDRRAAERLVRTLKTRIPGQTEILLLERQFDRIRRPTRLFDR